MALSQKHIGKILVPWFNGNEWNYVYNLIYSKETNDEKKSEAVNIMRIWKTRTSFLSSGVEGTLIILSALMTDQKKLDDEQLCLVWSSAILRFLNICAGSNRKQGTFYETARRYNIPDWLINIRHDIAHDQRMPSKYMLNMGLGYCLDWLKREYWIPQQKDIVDSEVKDVQETHFSLVLQMLNVYNSVVCESIRDVKVFRELSSSVKDSLMVFSNKFSDLSVGQILNDLSTLIVQKLDENDSVFFQNLAEFIISSSSFTKPDLGKIIAESVVHCWEPLNSSILLHNIFLPYISGFHDITVNENNTDSDRTCACLWILKILSDLAEYKAQSQCNPDMRFKEKYQSQLREFCDKVLNNPNLLTLNFIDSLLLLNGHGSECIREIRELITNYLEPAHRKPLDNTIYTVKDVCCELGDVSTQLERLLRITNSIESGRDHEKSRKWTKIDDTSDFKGCPLGVLPNQERTHNPLLKMKF